MHLQVFQNQWREYCTGLENLGAFLAEAWMDMPCVCSDTPL